MQGCFVLLLAGLESAYSLIQRKANQIWGNVLGVL